MRRRRKGLSGLVLVVVFFSWGITGLAFPGRAGPGWAGPGRAGPGRAGGQGAEKLVNQKAPLFELPDLDGKKVSLADFKGKVVLLNFWATWCPPCRREIPDLVALHRMYRSQGFSVIGVVLSSGSPQSVKKFAKTYNINYPILMGDSKVVKRYGNFQAIPTSFLIDRKGIIRRHYLGARTQKDFEEDILELLSEKARIVPKKGKLVKPKPKPKRE